MPWVNQSKLTNVSLGLDVVTITYEHLGPVNIDDRVYLGTDTHVRWKEFYERSKRQFNSHAYIAIGEYLKTH